MRLAILTLLCSLFVSALAANLGDKSNIEDLTVTFNQLVDEKNFSELGKVLTPDVTYEVGGGGPVQGLPATIDILSKIVPSTATTFNILSTQLIKFPPPFDKENGVFYASRDSVTTTARTFIPIQLRLGVLRQPNRNRLTPYEATCPRCRNMGRSCR